MNWVKFSFVFFVFSAPVFAEISNVKYGGKIASNFTNRTGLRKSTAAMAGYGWVEVEKRRENRDKISFSGGWSYERASAWKVLINHAYLEYQSDIHHLKIGRSLNAAGHLHHDLSDFGAPAAGLDNVPNSSFFAGSFTSNVAQQITQPFANRISYYIEPISFAVLGFSYTPKIAKEHPADFEYYTGSDHRDEVAAALSFKVSRQNRLIGATVGGTRSRYASDRNFDQSGDATSRQFSFYVRHDLNNEKYRLYEMAWGCMDADVLNKDCRGGWQISTIKGRWVDSMAYQKRIKSGEQYDDYSKGYLYRLGDNTDIGLESILRIKTNKSLRDGALHWNFGISHRF